MNKSLRSPTAVFTASVITTETALYLLAFFLALVLRLLNLGQSPLTDGEATWALQALQVARPGTAAFIPGPYPAYIFLTGATFSIFGASDFLARFWPALAGALLVWLPFFFRNSLGRKAALILAFGLAIDPGLVTVSRQVNGPMLAMGFGLLALGLWHARHPAWTGLLGGLALLSGPAFWQGALGVGLAWLTYRALHRSAIPPGEVFEEIHHPAPYPTRADTARGLIVFVATVLAVGTYLFRYPQGLAAILASLTTYLEGWATLSGVSPLTMAATLLVFQPLAMIFAVVSLGRWLARRFQNEVYGEYPLLFPLLWLLTSFFLTMIYPARQVSDLVWVLVPLWVLAADGLAEYLPDEKPHIISWLQAGLVLVLAALFWNTLIATSQIAPPSGLPWPVIQLGILLGILLLGALTTALVALGWSWQISRDGLVWGLAVSLVIYSTAMLWGSAQLRPNQPHELWGQAPGAGQVNLALATLQDLSNWHNGLVNKIDIVSTVDTPSIRWALRNFSEARFAAQVPPDEMPSVILTRKSAETPALTAAYRGQDFVWWVRPAWDGPLPADFTAWLTARKASLGYDYIILWARGDLFPGGSVEANFTEPQTVP
jgi:hypothetical protein